MPDDSPEKVKELGKFMTKDSNKFTCNKQYMLLRY